MVVTKSVKGGEIMPYRTDAELPEPVRKNLPAHAREIYRDAFNHAWDEYADPGKRRKGTSQEETAHRVAWAAVKKLYEKVGGRWVKKKD
jgi:cation transport regulator